MDRTHDDQSSYFQVKIESYKIPNSLNFVNETMKTLHQKTDLRIIGWDLYVMIKSLKVGNHIWFIDYVSK